MDDQKSLAALNKAIDLGVNFIDTADVYGDGHSERLIGQLKKDRPRDTIIVATKAGRRLPEQTPEGYTRENLNAWIDRSRKNLQMDCLDLVQLHCPHPKVYDMPEVFGILDEMTQAGKIRDYGISVETVDEALRGIRHPNVKTVQIIFNMFRLKPAEQFFPAAKAKQIGILARVPLASGLLTGKMTRQTKFAPDDHRSFNREGQAFDKGETFSGVPYDTALDAVDELKKICPPECPAGPIRPPLDPHVRRGELRHPRPQDPQAGRQQRRRRRPPSLSPQAMAEVQRIYDTRLRAIIHPQW